MLERADVVQAVLFGLFDLLEQLGELIEHSVVLLMQLVFLQDGVFKGVHEAAEMPEVLHDDVDEAIVGLLIVEHSKEHILAKPALRLNSQRSINVVVALWRVFAALRTGSMAVVVRVVR